jgi:hypothetical protein
MGRTPKRIKRRNRSASQGYAAKVEPRAKRPTPADDCSFEYECLSLFYEILSKAGLPKARLLEVSQGALAHIKNSRKSWDAGALAYFQRLPHILSLWHLLTEYVDSEYVHSTARPRKLKLSAPEQQPSLFGLIRRVLPNENPADVFETLRRVGAVRRSGQFWLPTGRTLVFKSAEVARLGILNEIRNFLRTAKTNLTRREKLLQRSVFNPAVPVRQLRTLNAREKTDADQFLILRDADLTAEQQRARTGEPVSGIGIGTYAYRDTPSVMTLLPKRRGSERKKTKKHVR